MKLIDILIPVATSISIVLCADCACSNDPTTCLLIWETNTGDASPNLAILPAWANATIYSPTCVGWGETDQGLDDNVKVFAWGLSLENPLLLNSEKLDFVGYVTPKFSYQGRSWDYYDCVCDVEKGAEETHVCNCPFTCADNILKRGMNS